MAAKSTKNTFSKFLKKHKLKSLLLTLPLLFAISFLATTSIYYSERIYPGVKIAGIDVGSMTKGEAADKLRKNTQVPKTITIKAKEKVFDMSLSGIEFTYDIDKTVDAAYLYARSNSFPQNLLGPLSLSNIKSANNLAFKFNVSEEKLDEYLQVISSQVVIEPVLPSVSLLANNLKIEKGSPGEYVDGESFKSEIKRNIGNNDFSQINLRFFNDDLSLTDEESAVLQNRAEKLLGKSIVLENEFDKFTLTEKEIFPFLDGNGIYFEDKLTDFISKEIEPKVNREPQNAVFNFQEGKVVEFKPAKNGLTVNKEFLKNSLMGSLTSLEAGEEKMAGIVIPVESKSPDITTDKVNDLGIKELLGRGTSKFVGSIPSRMYNISHASSKFNGVLVPPNSEFSFNNALGDVSALTGYKQAYVIRDGRTVLGDGGGVCQVSSTLFRALLNAGLPITERRAHSYRVGYYEQDVGPGLDATVFAPTTDLKFMNDTPAHLLIQTIYDGKNATLAFEIYGTSDGRKATTTKPVMLSQTKPPEDLYIDDPTLPTGQVKQVEQKYWGARVTFDYKVERDGQVIYEKTFPSTYRAWGAVFMKGTGPVI